MTYWQLLPCNPGAWLTKLAEGWRFACEWDAGLPAPYAVEWNGDWPVILMRRDA